MHDFSEVILKKYDTVLFDIDGTLLDPQSGLVASFAYALGKMNIPYGERQSLSRFIGPPLYSEWKRVFSLSDADADRALALFHEYYSVYGWWDNKIYGGITDLLSFLKEKNKILAVATSKPKFFAEKVLRLHGLDGYFDFVGAADGDRRRDKKHEIIEYVFENIGQEHRSSAILVGDRKYDAEGARIAGIDSLAASWGHGSRAEISEAEFNYTADSPRDVASIIC